MRGHILYDDILVQLWSGPLDSTCSSKNEECSSNEDIPNSFDGEFEYRSYRQIYYMIGYSFMQEFVWWHLW